ncbi:hypothetical protein BURK1_00392 [Burkholderiales bacterium]|nr:hypothetical protein BURK1_00392 [Burkholderiales bacterium]
MSANPAAPEPLVALAPIEIDLVVPCNAQRAFDYFTRDIGRWWPLATHSCAEDDAVAVAFEPCVGGRLVETARDGTTHPWGTVFAWEPGQRVAFSWHPGRDPATAQRVDVSFRAVPAGTRVTLVHGGWEALGERAAAAREAYLGGWATVFAHRYGDWCNGAIREGRT